jgi:hypothetical protein
MAFRLNVTRLDLAFRTRLGLGIIQYFAGDLESSTPQTLEFGIIPKKSLGKVGVADSAAPVAGSLKLVSSHE